jgi:hypothetical protein
MFETYAKSGIYKIANGKKKKYKQNNCSHSAELTRYF